MKDVTIINDTADITHVYNKEIKFPDIIVYADPEKINGFNTDDLCIGMRIQAEGKIRPYSEATNPGEFDQKKYYHALGIEGTMFPDNIRIIDDGALVYPEIIRRIKIRSSDVLLKICDPEDAGVLSTMLLGDKSSLDGQIRDLYQKNGIAHLLAVSGLHVSMLGLGFYHLARKFRLGIPQAGVLGLIVTVSYGFLTGGSASVVRAVMMVCFRISADGLGRTYDPLSAMSAASLFLLVRSPSLLFTAGFQLSFGAILAICFMIPAISDILGWKGNIKKSLLSGIAIQIVTGPIILYHYFEYPVYGFILNLFVIPLMTYVLLSGAAGTILGFFSLTAGRIAVGSSHYILIFYEWICKRFLDLPGSLWVCGRPKIISLVIYALLWMLFLYFAKNVFWDRNILKEDSGKEDSAKDNLAKENSIITYGSFIRTGAFMIVIVTGFMILRPLPPRGMEVTFLDVGQGDGICLRTDDTVALIDGGSTDKKKLGEQVLEPFFKSQGITQIDYAFLSHGDLDHYSGLSYLLEDESGIFIKNLFFPVKGIGNPAYDGLIEESLKAGTRIYWMQTGDKIENDGLKLSCLYSGEGLSGDDMNDHSLFIKASYENGSFFLTGDMSEEGEKNWIDLSRKLMYTDVTNTDVMNSYHMQKYLTQTEDIKVLKACHHGSNYSSSDEFLKFLSPDLCIISCGENNRYGHPGKETIGRLEDNEIPYLLTMDQGAVTIDLDKEKMTVKGFCSP